MTDQELEQPRQVARPLRLIARFLRRSWQAILVVFLAIALGVAAYLSPGLVQADVHLDEGTVYVAKRDDNLLGTVNAQIDELAAATTTGDSQFRILQHESDVQAFLPQSSNIHPYSPGRNILERATRMPPNAVVQQVGGNMLVYDRESGRVWHDTIEQMLRIDFLRDDPVFEVGEHGIATLTTSGKAIGLNVNDATLVRMQGEVAVTTPVPIEFNPETENFEISAVGENAVVLDRSNAQVWVEGMPRPFTLVRGQSDTVLLPPVDDVLGGEDGARGLFVNRAGLGAITPDGFRSMSGQINLTPVRPVQVGDCLYGAFYGGPGEGRIVKRCKGEEPVITEMDPEHLTSDGTQLEFQVNRTTVALNDMSNGTVWLVDRDTVILPEDWDHVRPAVVDETSDYTEGDPSVKPDRTQDNRAPVAKDDQLGARAGLSTILPVLDNDTDPDGDVLTISVPEGLTLDGATVQPVRGGAGLQISVDASASGVIQVPYIVHDGRGLTDDAVAHVTIYPQEPGNSNQAPYIRGGKAPDGTTVPGPQPLEVRLGDAGVTYRSLLDWRDPEGDPLILVDARMADGFDDIVEFRPDGEVTYTDVGKTPGPKTIEVTVADRHGMETEGVIHVNVSEEVVPPTTFGDFATTLQGEPVMVEPLANDIRADNLTEVTGECADCISAALADNRFTFTSEEVGSHYVDYSVNNGASGLVRIDVLPRLDNRPPVAVGDEAHLPAMGSVTIDPLLNDTDPDGDVLVIQTVTDVPPSLNVTMERRNLLTIEATTALRGDEKFHYLVSDGKESDRGTVQVVSTGASEQIGPRVEDDVLRVRAGATGAVKVLENDTSPDGRDLTLHPELMDNPFRDNAWVDDDTVRISVPAGAAPGVSQLRYRAYDSTGESSDGIVRVTVVSEDASNADPPQPRQVIDRVLGGTTTRIPIPLDGIDPQGDAVRLVGLGSIPQLGRVLSVGERYLEYEAFLGSAGTDTFQYKVVDSHGAEALGEIRIGVAPASDINNKPVAVTDHVLARPDRVVNVDPLLNDYDLDGDPIGFADQENPARMRDDIPVELVEGRRELLMTAPQEEGHYDGTYDIVDARGEPSQGLIRLTVDEEAPLLPPVTRDDLIDVASLGDKEYVEVDPLDNDYDPDGPREELRVVLPAADADDETAPRVTEDGNVSIPVRDTMQQVRYTAVDGDDLATNGVITVPGRDDVVPTLKDPDTSMKVRAGETLTIRINEVVQGTHGREVELPSNDHIKGYPAGSAKADGPSVITFVPDLGYHGPAVVAFLVRDLVPASDTTTARETIISIPVEVQRAEVARGAEAEGEDYLLNSAPVLLTTHPVLEVGAAEEEQSVDVTAFFRDPEGDSIRLLEKPRQVRGDAPIVWEERGNRIHARALDNARKGQSIVLQGTVIDGSADGNTSQFELTIAVVASRFPKVSAGEKKIEAVADESQQVSIRDVVTSYLPHDQTVILEGASVVSGGGSAVANPGDLSVNITAASGFHGTMVVSYTVNDALEDPDRRVDGRILVQVRDRPGKPGHPYGLVAGDGMVTFSYNSGGTGGDDANISATAVATSPTGGTTTGECGRGRCTVTGLQNGQAYTATVMETNSIGPSDPSEASAPFYPDAKLLPPTVVAAETGDSGLTVSWNHDRITASAHGSSPVREYLVRRYVGGVLQPEARTAAREDRSLWWHGLKNGEVSTFTVEAISQHADVARAAMFNSGESGQSNAEYPAGPPRGTIAVSPTTMQDDVGGGFRVSFDTSAVDINGDAISQYRIVPVTGGTEHTNRQYILHNPGAATSHEVPIYGMGTSATQFRVYATNRHSEVALGLSDPPLISWARPQISSVQAAAGDGSITLTVSHNMPSHSPGRLQYSTGDGWKELQGNVISGLRNGRPYAVQVRAVLENMESAVATANEVRPKGAAPTPPSEVRFTAVSPEKVRVHIAESTWESSNGYEPTEFLFCWLSSSGDCLTDRSRSLSIDISYGDQRIRWFHGEHSGTIRANSDMPVLPSHRPSDDLLLFSFPYVRDSDGCVITVNNEQQKEVAASGGQLRHSAAVKYQPPPYTETPAPPEDPEAPTPEPTVITPPPESPDKIRVSCVIGGASGPETTWNPLK